MAFTRWTSISAVCDIVEDSFLELCVFAYFCLGKVQRQALYFQEKMTKNEGPHTRNTKQQGGGLDKVGPLTIGTFEVTMFPVTSWHQRVWLFNQLDSNLLSKRWDPKKSKCRRRTPGLCNRSYHCFVSLLFLWQDNRTFFSSFALLLLVFFAKYLKREKTYLLTTCSVLLKNSTNKNNKKQTLCRPPSFCLFFSRLAGAEWDEGLFWRWRLRQGLFVICARQAIHPSSSQPKKGWSQKLAVSAQQQSRRAVKAERNWLISNAH